MFRPIFYEFLSEVHTVWIDAVHKENQTKHLVFFFVHGTSATYIEVNPDDLLEGNGKEIAVTLGPHGWMSDVWNRIQEGERVMSKIEPAPPSRAVENNGGPREIRGKKPKIIFLEDRLRPCGTLNTEEKSSPPSWPAYIPRRKNTRRRFSFTGVAHGYVHKVEVDEIQSGRRRARAVECVDIDDTLPEFVLRRYWKGGKEKGWKEIGCESQQEAWKGSGRLEITRRNGMERCQFRTFPGRGLNWESEGRTGNRGLAWDSTLAHGGTPRIPGRRVLMTEAARAAVGFKEIGKLHGNRVWNAGKGRAPTSISAQPLRVDAEDAYGQRFDLHGQPGKETCRKEIERARESGGCNVRDDTRSYPAGREGILDQLETVGFIASPELISKTGCWGRGDERREQSMLPNGALLRGGPPRVGHTALGDDPAPHAVRLAHVMAFSTPRIAALPRIRNHNAHASSGRTMLRLMGGAAAAMRKKGAGAALECFTAHWDGATRLWALGWTDALVLHAFCDRVVSSGSTHRVLFRGSTRVVSTTAASSGSVSVVRESARRVDFLPRGFARAASIALSACASARAAYTADTGSAYDGEGGSGRAGERREAVLSGSGDKSERVGGGGGANSMLAGAGRGPRDKFRRGASAHGAGRMLEMEVRTGARGGRDGRRASGVGLQGVRGRRVEWVAGVAGAIYAGECGSAGIHAVPPAADPGRREMVSVVCLRRGVGAARESPVAMGISASAPEEAGCLRANVLDAGRRGARRAGAVCAGARRRHTVVAGSNTILKQPVLQVTDSGFYFSQLEEGRGGGEGGGGSGRVRHVGVEEADAGYRVHASAKAARRAPRQGGRGASCAVWETDAGRQVSVRRLWLGEQALMRRNVQSRRETRQWSHAAHVRSGHGEQARGRRLGGPFTLCMADRAALEREWTSWCIQVGLVIFVLPPESSSPFSK
ncbi:hypothetical protein B0H16DRAFT_1704842 [Mycena metata]|uniref:Uncharacterized protein n=1 Tax=Mycena metata TaxID=1033252 RepID=A0AAD7M765_9AGAR|nr:hypothetical protein B0H16DRAFT_1704842 [Mycena metata]